MQRQTDCKLNCKLTTLSPLHIGSGEVYTGLDYHIHDGFLYLIDIHDISKHLVDEKGLSHNHVIEVVKEPADTGKLSTLVSDYDLPFEKLSRQKIAFSSNPNYTDEIHAFIKGSTDNRKNYIPGSSLKGAIRTAIIWNYYKNNNHLDELAQKLSENETRGSIKKLESVENDLFGRDSNCKMRFLAISDSMEEVKKDHESKIMEIKIASPYIQSKSLEWMAGYRKRTEKIHNAISLYYECVDKDEEFLFQINLLRSKAENMNIELIEPESIITACNEFLKYQIIEDCKYISTYNLSESHLYEFYENLIKQFNELKQNEAIVHLGWGTGWLSKTFTSHIKDNFPGCFDSQNKQKSFFGDRKKIGADHFPKTRRFIVQDDEPMSTMGWVKIVFPEDKIKKGNIIKINCSQYLKKYEKNNQNKPIVKTKKSGYKISEIRKKDDKNKTTVKRGDKLHAKIIRISGHMADIEITEDTGNVQRIVKQVSLPYGHSLKKDEQVMIKIEKLYNNKIKKCKIVS